MTDPYLDKLVRLLQRYEPDQIILFGSRARGEAEMDSDYDLIVVTQSDQLPASQQEQESAYLEVARLIRDIRKEVPVDLIVHTRPMHARFIEMDSLFAREVLQKGVVLYESHHA